jgi:hypothetical protein
MFLFSSKEKRERQEISNFIDQQNSHYEQILQLPFIVNYELRDKTISTFTADDFYKGYVRPAGAKFVKKTENFTFLLNIEYKIPYFDEYKRLTSGINIKCLVHPEESNFIICDINKYKIGSLDRFYSNNFLAFVRGKRYSSVLTDYNFFVQVDSNSLSTHDIKHWEIFADRIVRTLKEKGRYKNFVLLKNTVGEPVEVLIADVHLKPESEFQELIA